jgi:hypothetical protein
MPPASTPERPKKKTRNSISGFRRVQIGLNVVVQIVAMFCILLFINWFAFKHHKQFDFSRDHKYALSQRTKQFVDSLSKPIKLIVFMNVQSPLQNDVDNLVNEYRNARPKLISIESVDPFRNLTRATEIQAKYKLAQQENVLIVDCDGHTKIIRDEQMADVDEGNPMFGQPPKITAFKGEQAVTSALIEVTENKKSTVYYLRGHGEPDVKLAGSPLELVGQLLDAEHIALQELNLLNVEVMPEDTGAVMILGPSYDLTEREIKLLGDYWEKSGRILALLNPDAQTPRLHEFLGRVGIRPDDDRLMALGTISGVTRVIRNVVAEFVGASPITKQLADVNTIFFGSTQSLSLNPEVVRAANVKLEPLLQPVKGFWGEADYKNLDESATPSFEDGKDKKDPLVIAASVEKGAVGDQRVQLGSARMIVVGNSLFIRRDALTQANASLFVSSLNWLLAREQLIGIAPKPIKTYTLNLPESQVATIMWVSTLAVPGFFAVVGVLVWLRRRA